jgi:N-acyl-D-amino-acid deacylase
MNKNISFFLIFFSVFYSCHNPKKYDTIIRHALIYDGNGGTPYAADLAIQGDSIAFIGDLKNTDAANNIEAGGLALAPGFINMLGQGMDTLIEDGRSESDIRQGVTLEVFGEGESMGPLNPLMQETMKNGQSLIKFEVRWNTLKGYLDFLERKGVSCNIASFVGATTDSLLNLWSERITEIRLRRIR